MDERIKQDYTDYYDIIELIGTGTFSSVYKGKLKSNENELRAIKVIDLVKIKENLINKDGKDNIEEKLHSLTDGFIEEFKNMKICSENNKNSIKCYEYFINEKYFVIIMELCDTNLQKILLEYIESGHTFIIKELLALFDKINKTFKIMKENNIIHRNLKLKNILM